MSMDGNLARTLDTAREAVVTNRHSHARLELFLGTWRTTGRQSDCPFGRAGTIVALETYQWLSGERFMIHRLDGRIDDEPLACIEVIGTGSAQASCPVHTFYGDGRSNEWSLSEENGVWLLTGEWHLAGSVYFVRSSVWFTNGGNTRAGKWEYSKDGGAFHTFWEVTSSKTT